MTGRAPKSRRRDAGPPPPGTVDLWLIALPQGGGTRELWPRIRRIVAAYLDLPARAVEFVRGRHGRPDIGGGHRLAVGLAHSGRMAALAVTDGRPVGIDIEVLRPVPDAVALGHEHFGRAIGAELAGLAEPRRSRRFLYYWTRLEARAKAFGDDVSATVGRHASAATGRGATPGDPHLADLRLRRGYAAALCVPGPPPVIRLRRPRRSVPR